MKVLLIEDELLAGRGTALGLRGEDVYVDMAACGEEGLEFARHFDYDAIILDLGLPDISGFEVLRTLRRAGIDTPVIVLSGSAATSDKIKALNGGADDYLTKPFDRQELVVRLRALIRRSRGYADSRISFGQMTLDLVAKTVETGGRRVRLSGKEYQILELLSLRRGAAVSKETLINHIYSDGEGPDSPTIGLFMYRLRKKLAAASGGEHFIETVRDQGYLLPRAA
ncbi:MAG: response regulator transcription factor [Acetobacteraceae bacterium]|nr:response regulator transcription factor [Acetobacteraceae bacterium]